MSGDPDRAMLDAFVDGELPASEMTRIAALVVQRSDLRSYVENQERLRRTLQDSFASLMREPVPERLQHAVHQAVIAPARKNAWSVREFFPWRVIWPAAAALALGLVVGFALDRFAATEGALLKATPRGETVARGELARVLSDRLASTQNPADAIRVGLSFRSRSGDDCRTFEWDGAANSMSGIACHNDGEWVVQALAAQAPNAHARAPYQMAGAGMPDAIRASVQEMISGRPFDASAERAARASHWAGARSQ